MSLRLYGWNDEKYIKALKDVCKINGICMQVLFNIQHHFTCCLK